MSEARPTLAVQGQRNEPAATLAHCAGCLYRQEDRQALERSVAGLSVFSSAFGATIGASRLCRLHDRWVSPTDSCSRFIQRS